MICFTLGTVEKQTNFTMSWIMKKRKHNPIILDLISLYRPNKQYNEISARNTVVVHNNTAYETVENRAEYLECGEFNQASLYECVNSLD